jgi:hypothetical protein
MIRKATLAKRGDEGASALVPVVAAMRMWLASATSSIVAAPCGK